MHFIDLRNFTDEDLEKELIVRQLNKTKSFLLSSTEYDKVCIKLDSSNRLTIIFNDYDTLYFSKGNLIMLKLLLDMRQETDDNFKVGDL